MASFTSSLVDHPGTFIAEELEERGWIQADLSYILGMDAGQLNKLINGKADITPDSAVSLGDAFDMPAEFFLDLQKQYSVSRARKADPGVKTRATWLSKFPVREMMHRGWIEKTDADLLDLQMMRFFGANRLDDVPLVGCNAPAYAAKKSDLEEITGGQLVWLYRVRKIAEAMAVPAYDRAKLAAALPDIRAHMFDLDDLSEIPSLLSACGVRTVFVEPLPGSKIDGVCTWLDDQPVIGLSLRMNRPDNLCFVLWHELSHVLHGDGRGDLFAHIDVFEPDRDQQVLSEEEKRADAEAAEALIPQDMLLSFMQRKGRWISETDVLAFSARHHIHPSIVIGQIHNQRHKAGDKRAFAFLRSYMTKVDGYFKDWPLRDGWGSLASVEL